MVYYIPYITGQYNPLYNPTNQGFFRGSYFDKDEVVANSGRGNGKVSWWTVNKPSCNYVAAAGWFECPPSSDSQMTYTLGVAPSQ